MKPVDRLQEISKLSPWYRIPDEIAALVQASLLEIVIARHHESVERYWGRAHKLEEMTRRIQEPHDEITRSPADLSDSVLRERADDLLSEHGVRIRVEGTTFEEMESTLQASVTNAIGEVHLKRSDSGFGLIRVDLNESWTFNRGYCRASRRCSWGQPQEVNSIDGGPEV